MVFSKSGLLTTLSTDDIENLLFKWLGGIKCRNICVPNVSWGMFKYEMDFVAVTPKGKLTEIEIKRSWSDFMADFKKTFYHDDCHVADFWYCVPSCMINETENFLVKRGYTDGLMAYSDDGKIKIFKLPQTRKGFKRLNEGEIYKLARLATIRFWTHRNVPPKTADRETQNELIRLRTLFNEIKADYTAAVGEDWKLEDYR